MIYWSLVEGIKRKLLCCSFHKIHSLAISLKSSKCVINETDTDQIVSMGY